MKKLLGIVVLGLLLSGCQKLQVMDESGTMKDWDEALLDQGQIIVISTDKKKISIMYEPLIVPEEKIKNIAENLCKQNSFGSKVELVSTSIEIEYNKKMKVFRCL
jgi:hypothetical protein